MNNKIKVIGALLIAGTVATIGIGAMTAGVNDAGYTTVVQYPTGTMKVHLEPGWYFKWFGNTTIYAKQITMDADNDEAASGATIDQMGISVRYSDGGTGTIYGKMRYSLPENREDMLKVHAAFRSANGVAYKLLKSVTEEAVNQTAALMKSEEGFDSKRAVFTQWAKAQIKLGLFETEAQWISEKDEVTGKTVSKQIAVIKMEKGVPQHYASELSEYGISLVGFQLNNPTFEKKTLDQIAEKRAATMAIITAKANAEKAKQDAITAEAQGKANVMTARYEKEVEKERAVTDAEKVAEVAVIKAKQRVDVAKAAKDEAEQFKLKAGEIKLANILEGEGQAEKNRLIIESDGALDKKIAAVVAINKAYAVAMGQQKWVPETNMISGGVSGDTNGSAATDLINLLTVQAAKAVNVDLEITK